MQTSGDSKALWMSVLAGAAGGLVGSFLTNRFQATLEAVTKPAGNESDNSDQDVTIKTAQLISRKIFDHDLTQSEKKWAGPVVHYTFGTILGAAYGALPLNAGAGTLYGTAVWLGADEVAVPSLRLSETPEKTPVVDHAKALASHLVFGLATHFTRTAILKLAGRA